MNRYVDSLVQAAHSKPPERQLGEAMHPKRDRGVGFSLHDRVDMVPAGAYVAHIWEPAFTEPAGGIEGTPNFQRDVIDYLK